MKMLTLKLTPKRIFGIVLLLVGIIVISVTFVSNHTSEAQSVSAVISAKTDSERRAYLSKYGYKLASDCEQKEITIPKKWNDVYNSYNQIQKIKALIWLITRGKKQRFTPTQSQIIKARVTALLPICLFVKGNLSAAIFAIHLPKTVFSRVWGKRINKYYGKIR